MGMRLDCKVIVQPSNSNSFRSRPAFGTVAVNNKVLFVKFQAKNKTQSKFDLNKENVSKIHEKFIGKGKLTVQFRQPRADVMISECADNSLKSFVKRFHAILDGKDDGPNQKQSSTSIASTKPAKTVLEITRLADYPRGGFPNTLQKLSITGIERNEIDRDWFSLEQLTDLDLSNNKLGEETKFDQFTQVARLLKLKSLILANNRFRHLPLYFWRSLPKSLIHLDVSDNELERIPPELGQLKKLIELMLNNNHLVELPMELGSLGRLRTLNISHNCLRYLPETISWLSKDIKLDATANHPDLYPRWRYIPTVAEGGVASLQEFAAVVVKVLGLEEMIFPEKLRQHLMSDPNTRCVWCRKLRAPSSMFTVHSVFDLSRKFSTIITQNQQGKFVQVRGLFCNRSCFHFV